LHLEERGKINLRRWSNVNHNVYRDASLKQTAS
jgi:hypothetical protein